MTEGAKQARIRLQGEGRPLTVTLGEKSRQHDCGYVTRWQNPDGTPWCPPCWWNTGAGRAAAQGLDRIALGKEADGDG